MGELYVVATPIGNLEDITLRALRVLRSVSLVAAEDTRHARKLLAKYDIDTPLTSYFEHNKLSKLEYILGVLRDKDVAIISDAGTPGISDPGFELIQAAIGQGTLVVPIPGPSAVIAALCVSGLPTDQFVYVGFFPRKHQERIRVLEALRAEARTIVAFEAPHRLTETLEDINDSLGDRRVAVVREVTKIHEETVRGTVTQAIDHFRTQAPRGEFTLVIAGAGKEVARPQAGEAETMLRRLVGEGCTPKDAVALVARETGLPRREVYRTWLDIK